MAWGSRVARVLDTRSIVRFGSSGKSVVHGRREAGLVDEHDERRHRRGLLGGGDQRASPGPNRGPGHRERARGGDAEVEERDAERDRTGELELDRRAPSRDGAEERPQSDERLTVDPGGGERRPRIEHRIRQLQRAVGEDPDAIDPPGGLGDHPLHAGAVRQRRRGGQARLTLEHEGRGRARVGVRQAPDRAGHPVLKVDDLHSPLVLPSHCSPWLVNTENGQPSCAWANLSVPWPSLLDPGLLASRGVCCRSCSDPRSATRSAITAWRWRAPPRAWRGSPGPVCSSRSCCRRR